MSDRQISHSMRKAFAICSLLIIDALALLLAFFSSVHIRLQILPAFFGFFPADFPLTYTTHLWWILILCLGCLAYAGLYTKRRSFWPETRHLFVSISLAFILIMAVVSLAKLSGEVSRTSIVISYLLALIIMPLVRYGGKVLLFNIGIWEEPVLILGFNHTGCLVAEALQNDQYLGYRLAGFLTMNGESDYKPQKDYNIAGSYEQAKTIITSQGIRHIIIAAPHLPGSELVELSNGLQPYTRSIIIVPDLVGLPMVDGETDYFFNEQILALRIKNNLASRMNMVIKRIFDLVMALLLLIPLVLIMFIFSILIKADSAGPVFYISKRIGRQGKEFKCLKFRTMFLDNDRILEEYFKSNADALQEWQQYYKLRGEDPRVTGMGKFLRKTSLDELPQIINVLKGEMSLVGARPYLPEEKLSMGSFADTILLANPGMTGLWQVSGRSEIDFEGRLRMEAWYVRNWSIWLDISLMFRTISVVLRREGAY